MGLHGRVDVDVRRSAGRYLSDGDGVRTRHAFSFGPHYDPANTRFGSLLVHDEHALEPGCGFALHRHRDVEVVTWVLDGALHHEDSAGARGVLRPGTVQRMRAGSGVEHSEVAGVGPVRFLQAWLVPAEAGGDPLVAWHAPPSGPGLVRALALEGAVLHLGRLTAGERVELPPAPYVHVHVARGDLALAGERLGAGDAARLSGAGAPVAVAGPYGAEALVWAMAPPGRPAPR